MLVVCGGVKSILDVPKTLEALETRGVASPRSARATPGLLLAPLARRRRRAEPRAAPVDSGRGRGLVQRAPRAGARLGPVLAVRPAPLPTEAVEAAARRSAAARDAGVAGADATPSSWRTSSGAAAGRSTRTWPSSQQRRRRGRRRGRAGATAARRPARRRRCGARRSRAGGRGDGRHVGARRRARVAGVGANVARAAARAAPTALPRRRTRRRRAGQAGVDVRGCYRRRRADVRRAADADGDLVGGVFAGAATPRRGRIAVAGASSSSTRT